MELNIASIPIAFLIRTVTPRWSKRYTTTTLAWMNHVVLNPDISVACLVPLTTMRKKESWQEKVGASWRTAAVLIPCPMMT